MKEAIMKVARSKSTIDIEGGQISQFMDFSRRTLMQWRAVRPLLEALHVVNVNYRGFPFCLMASLNSKKAVIQTKDDLKYFVETLDLPTIDFPD